MRAEKILRFRVWPLLCNNIQQITNPWTQRNIYITKNEIRRILVGLTVMLVEHISYYDKSESKLDPSNVMQ